MLDQHDRHALRDSARAAASRRRRPRSDAGRPSPRRAAAVSAASPARARLRAACGPAASARARERAARDPRSSRPTISCARTRAASICGACSIAPIATLSSTVRSGNGRTIWNVRARPRAADVLGRLRRRCAAPSKRMSPASGLNTPAMRLNSVVLPAPFGPMTAKISPGATASDTSSTATSPRKRFVTP